MSNYYKSAHIQGEEKRIIATKKIEIISFPSPSESLDAYSEEKAGLQQVNEIEKLEDKKKELLAELNSLQQKIDEIELEIKQKLDKAEEDINQWWTTKQQEAEQLAEQTKEEAAQEGYQQGYNQGFQQIMAEMESKLSQAEEVIASAYTEKEQIIQEAEPFLLSLSIKIAEKIIQQHLTMNENAILEIIRHELEQVREKGEVTILVPPQEYQYLLPYKEELMHSIPTEIDLKIIPDRNSGPGCIIQTPSGSYDVTIDNQLQEIKKQLIAFYEESVNQ